MVSTPWFEKEFQDIATKDVVQRCRYIVGLARGSGIGRHTKALVEAAKLRDLRIF